MNWLVGLSGALGLMIVLAILYRIVVDRLCVASGRRSGHFAVTGSSDEEEAMPPWMQATPDTSGTTPLGILATTAKMSCADDGTQEAWPWAWQRPLLYGEAHAWAAAAPSDSASYSPPAYKNPAKAQAQEQGKFCPAAIMSPEIDCDSTGRTFVSWVPSSLACPAGAL